MEAKMTVTGRTLKWVGILSMTLDHIGAVLLGSRIPEVLEGAGPASAAENLQFILYLFLRFAGRLAFPVFCFLLTEGFCHTSSRKRYAGRMFFFAVISEIPFDLAFHGKILESGGQNVFITLFLGIAVMFLLEKTENRTPGTAQACSGAAGMAARAAIIGSGCAVAEILRCDYGWFGILLISVLYLLRAGRKGQTAAGAALCLPEITAPLAFFFISRYQGAPGKRGRKYFFYMYYPLHLLVLVFIRHVLF